MRTWLEPHGTDLTGHLLVLVDQHTFSRVVPRRVPAEAERVCCQARISPSSREKKTGSALKLLYRINYDAISNRPDAFDGLSMCSGYCSSKNRDWVPRLLIRGPFKDALFALCLLTKWQSGSVISARNAHRNTNFNCSGWDMTRIWCR